MGNIPVKLFKIWTSGSGGERLRTHEGRQIKTDHKLQINKEKILAG